MIRIFIGFDLRETVAFHVLAQSLMHHASSPISITPLNRRNLQSCFSRERGQYDSTDFAVSRFLVPMLCDFQGRAIFLDCDMLARDDIAKLLSEVESNPESAAAAVCVVKHDYIPSTAKKFLNQTQTEYARKNWSSVMVFNNARCRMLTRSYVESAPGLDLHQFAWVRGGGGDIGSLNKKWNCLIGEENQCLPSDASILHFTLGTPCFREYADCEMAPEWHRQWQLSQHPLSP